MVSGCAEGKLVGLAQGKTLLRACPVKAALMLGGEGRRGALKMCCWQALLEKYWIEM